jgi:hypothetical protein
MWHSGEPLIPAGQALCYFWPVLTIRAQERIASLVAAGGVLWTVSVVTKDFTVTKLMQPLSFGPLEMCAAGIILWLIAKWRRAVRP